MIAAGKGTLEWERKVPEEKIQENISLYLIYAFLMCLLTLLDVGIYRGTEEEEGILFFFSLIF